MQRRRFLQLLAAAPTALALPPAWAAATADDERFIFIHASGGWDVTLWADPRAEHRGLIDPASTDNTDVSGLTRWKGRTLDGDVQTFEPLTAPGSSLVLGPGIGDLWDLRDRLTIINGLAMNTVSHPDGTNFSATGRHLTGGRAPTSSVDVLLANELGRDQLLPDVAIQYPAAFVGDQLDRRAIPLRVGSAATIARSLARSDAYHDATDRAAITALLTAEAADLAGHAAYPETYARLGGQLATVPRLLTEDLKATFTAKALQDRYPALDLKGKGQAAGALSAAFAVEALRKDLVRCVGFSMGGLDTHNANYRQHAKLQQDLFGVVAALVKLLDVTPHPTRAGDPLAAHTHLMVFSDFCRTPMINLAGGRDHYPNNSTLIISPRFRGGVTYGKTDPEQLLPADAGTFTDGARPVAPPDVLATFLAAFGVPPRRYLRDGEVIREVLR
jgi:uncharacterized protein (DUF1501 family)